MEVWEDHDILYHYTTMGGLLGIWLLLSAPSCGSEAAGARSGFLDGQAQLRGNAKHWRAVACVAGYLGAGGGTTTTTCVLTPRSVAARQSRRQVRARDPPRGWPPTPLRPPPPLPSDEGDGGSEGMARAATIK
jgi:hypothetical protein